MDNSGWVFWLIVVAGYIAYRIGRSIGSDEKEAEYRELKRKYYLESIMGGFLEDEDGIEQFLCVDCAGDVDWEKIPEEKVITAEESFVADGLSCDECHREFSEDVKHKRK